MLLIYYSLFIATLLLVVKMAQSPLTKEELEDKLAEVKEREKQEAKIVERERRLKQLLNTPTYGGIMRAVGAWNHLVDNGYGVTSLVNNIKNIKQQILDCHERLDSLDKYLTVRPIVDEKSGSYARTSWVPPKYRLDEAEKQIAELQNKLDIVLDELAVYKD